MQGLCWLCTRVAGNMLGHCGQSWAISGIAIEYVLPTLILGPLSLPSRQRSWEDLKRGPCLLTQWHRYIFLSLIHLSMLRQLSGVGELRGAHNMI